MFLDQSVVTEETFHLITRAMSTSSDVGTKTIAEDQNTVTSNPKVGDPQTQWHKSNVKELALIAVPCAKDGWPFGNGNDGLLGEDDSRVEWENFYSFSSA